MLATVVLTVAVLVADLRVPQGVAIPIAYVAPVLLSLQLPGRRYTIAVAAACTVLTLIGYLYFSTDGEWWKVVTNRTLSVFAIWVAVALGLLRKRGHERLEEAYAGVERQVEKRTAELARANQQLSSIYNTVGDVIYALVVESAGKYRFVSVNPAFYTITGLKPDQVIGKRVDEVIPEPSLTFVLERYAEAIREKRAVRWEETSEYPTGRLTGEVSVAPAFDEAGNCTHLVGAVHDITERERAEGELIAARDRYSKIFETAPVAIATTDKEGYIRTVNRAHMEMFGVKNPDDYIGKVNALTAPNIAQAGLKGLVEDVLQGKPSTFLGAHYFSVLSNKEVYINVRGVPLLDERSQMEGGLFIIADVTEREQAQRRLERVNRHLRMLSQCNQALVHATGEQELLCEVCRAIVEVGGYRMAWVGLAEEDENKTVRPAAHAGFEEGYLDTLDLSWADNERGRGPTGTAIRTGQPIIMQNLLTDPRFAPWRAEATKRGYASSVSLPLIHGDRIFGVLRVYAGEPDAFDPEEMKLLTELASDLAYGIAALRTRAERAWAEEALEESNRNLREALEHLRAAQQQVIQQERLRALGEMVGGIAHDFNNVLTPILALSELLLERPINLLEPDRVKLDLQTINIAAKDATVVVRRMREFYRPREPGETFLPVDLQQVVAQAISLTQPRWRDQAMAKGITVNIETDLQEVPPVPGHESELREVLVNLIFNAVDAMPQGGTLTICTRPEGGLVILEVRDTGTGMTEEVRRRCLEPFFTTKGEHGTGLGLSIAYGIIQRHEGTIDIESELGRGTAVIIRLPAWMEERAEERTGKVEAERTGVARRLQVLVVDDEPLVQRVMTEYLLTDNHTVVTARNGHEGLEKFRAGRFDLVMTDMAMPELTGDRLAAAIKEINPATPIILLSGFGDMIPAAARPRGVDLIVGKPVTLSGLREAIAKVIHGAT